MTDIVNATRQVQAATKVLVAPLYGAGFVYPTMTRGAAVVSANANWALGSVALVMPAGHVPQSYRLDAIVVETLDRAAVFELVLYQGADDAEVSRIRLCGVGYYILTGALVPGGARLRAALASSNGAAEIATVRISVCYHLVE
jgi:hypothetical protein